MKKLIILMLLIVCLIPKNVYSNSTYTNIENEAVQLQSYKGSLLSLLYPYISSSVDKYYGYPQQFDLDDAKIISIKKTPERFEYEITVQVETFTGAHNPPRAIETITVLASPMGTMVINYEHKPE